MTAADFVPPGPVSLDDLRAAASGCRGCRLFENATQTVFGEGGERADLVLVGEQPGDQEDRAGEPFVGPAGKLLDRALRDAGIDREQAYVTNVVKHFKWRPAGRRRLHQKPNAEEIGACRPWLDAELEQAMATVHPSTILRAPDDEARHREYEAFVADLKVQAEFATRSSGQQSAQARVIE